jgi:hypothetical protein
MTVAPDDARQVIRAFSQRLTEELSVDDAGFAQLADLGDRRLRAVVSDHLIASIDGIEGNLREASEHASLLIELAGPNGRTMPDPAQPQEEQEMRAMDREFAGFLRAIGSSLDCLSAAAIVALRLPTSIRRASAESLTDLGARSEKAEGDQGFCWTRTARRRAGRRRKRLVRLDRNAVVHRARQLRIWLPLPSAPRPASSRLIVPTRLPASRLIRYELHLRRKPWLADLESLSSSGEAAENWLVEPATDTVRGILERIEVLIQALTGSLFDSWVETSEQRRVLPAPTQSWQLTVPSQRAQNADSFRGFDLDYPVPPLTAIVTNPREATRAAIAEALRQEGITLDDVE